MVNISLPHGRARTVAVCDIRPGAASFALLVFSRGGSATVLATGHYALSLEARTDEQTLSMIGQHVEEAVQQALKQAGGHKAVESVYIIVHAPWATSLAVHAEEHFPKEV